MLTSGSPDVCDWNLVSSSHWVLFIVWLDLLYAAHVETMHPCVYVANFARVAPCWLGRYL